MVLPVLFVVIVIFGHGADRFRSAFLFFLYTLAGSLPMLLSILTIYSYIGSTDFQLLSLYEINIDFQKVLWIGFFIGFAVKTPLYPFIIWLKKAHSDSVLAGSVLLAATILKLATYGALWNWNLTFMCLQLSNYGDTIKLMVPNNNCKIISGWTNYSGRVITHEILEKEIGYRVSKSDLNIKKKICKRATSRRKLLWI
jgi:NADH:ubiquinone oxidoreductase subunit 4 (subunit M)